MKWLKYILLAMVLLAASWPCMHEVASDRHAHDDACGIELCASATHDCHCHSCEEQPCLDRSFGVVKRIAAPDGVWVARPRILLFTLSETRPFRNAPDLRCPSGMLASLQTIQLLI